MTTIQIKNFIENYSVTDTFLKSFSSLLDQNTNEDLDITDKNVSIDVENLAFELLDSYHIAFKSQIDQDGNKIGYYRLVFALDGTLIDDFFVIY